MLSYKDRNVLDAAKERIAFIFDRFDNIEVSVSGGKDSTTLWHLCVSEAERRNRQIRLFFLDQEAEYESSIEVIRHMMAHPNVLPAWYQVPALMTNATSHVDYFLTAWEPGQVWMREKDPIAIHSIEGKYPARFYSFFEWHEQQAIGPTACIVGLRSNESLNRFRSVTKSPGYDGKPWSTKTKNPQAFRFYPLYDWFFGDVWKYIADNELKYSRIYDLMFAKHGINMSKMRISNLIHERSFACLVDLQEYEPQTHDKLVKRLGGVHCASIYAKDKFVLSARELPAGFTTWLQYRDYLLSTTPIDRVERFHKRFAKQSNEESICQEQVRQILINDWENNVPVTKPKQERLREIWWDRL